MGTIPLEFYRIIYDNFPQGIIILKNDEIFYINKALAELVEYPLETMQGWSVEELFKPLLTKQEELKSLYEMGGNPDLYGVIHEFAITTGAGKEKYIHMIPVMFTIGEEEYYHAMLLDVSTQMKAVQELKESEERFRNTFDSIPDAAYLWERNNEGRITLKLVNQRVMEMTRGLSKTYLGKEPNDLFVDNPEFVEFIQHTMATGQEIITESTITHPQMPSKATTLVKCVRPVDDLVLMINTDITEERRVQEIARQSEREKSIILNSMLDQLVYYESEDLKIAWANKAAADALSMVPSELVGKYCYELWQKRSTPCDNCSVMKAWRTGIAQETETHTPDGRTWHVKGIPVKNTAEQVTSVIEVAHDITERKQAEELMHEAKNRAELYLDLLGHDLNNIHQGIIIGLELALQDNKITEQSKIPILTSLEQVNRGVNLIANIQKFSTIIDAPTNLTEMPLLPVITTDIELVRNSFPKRELKVNLDLSDDGIIVYADEFLVDAIFNVLHNSMKHDDSEVVQIEIRAKESGNFVQIQINDRGPGIEEDAKQKLLNRLDTGIKAGSGMGMTLVKRIMERYNGKIEIKDRVLGDHKQGACIVLYIPVKQN